jgi:hypothetical protein
MNNRWDRPVQQLAGIYWLYFIYSAFPAPCTLLRVSMVGLLSPCMFSLCRRLDQVTARCLLACGKVRPNQIFKRGLDMLAALVLTVLVTHQRVCDKLRATSGRGARSPPQTHSTACAQTC